MSKQLIVNANYNGLDVSFTGDGWFNATQAAERFNKRPNDWLNLDETKASISALSDISNTSQNDIWINTKRGNNGGTWLHPDLVVPFALIAITGHIFFHTSCVGSEITIALNTSTVEGLNKNSIIALSISLLSSCQPSYAEVGKSLFGGNSDFVQELNKISYLSPLTVSKEKDFLIYLLFSIDLIAVTGNNLKQELRNLLNTVQHHTIVDVFLCLSFSNLPFWGKLCFALALVRLWWGGRGNKPFGANTVCRVCFAVSNLPAALHLGQSSKKLPFEKV